MKIYFAGLRILDKLGINNCDNILESYYYIIKDKVDIKSLDILKTIKGESNEETRIDRGNSEG